MAAKPKTETERLAPQLYLVTPPVQDAAAFARMLESTLGTAGVAAVLLRLVPGGESDLVDRIKLLAPIAERAGAALLLDGNADLVGRSGADGAHLTGIRALEDAIGRLKPDRIAGAGGMTTRHDAMLAAEADADYILFGEPDLNGQRPSPSAIEDRVSGCEVLEGQRAQLVDIFLNLVAAYDQRAGKSETESKPSPPFGGLRQGRHLTHRRF